jgi:hypothetical protein
MTYLVTLSGTATCAAWARASRPFGGRGLRAPSTRSLRWRRRGLAALKSVFGQSQYRSHRASWLAVSSNLLGSVIKDGWVT